MTISSTAMEWQPARGIGRHQGSTGLCGAKHACPHVREIGSLACWLGLLGLVLGHSQQATAATHRRWRLANGLWTSVDSGPSRANPLISTRLALDATGAPGALIVTDRATGKTGVWRVGVNAEFTSEGRLEPSWGQVRCGAVQAGRLIIGTQTELLHRRDRDWVALPKRQWSWAVPYPAFITDFSVPLGDCSAMIAAPNGRILAAGTLCGWPVVASFALGRAGQVLEPRVVVVGTPGCRGCKFAKPPAASVEHPEAEGTLWIHYSDGTVSRLVFKALRRPPSFSLIKPNPKVAPPSLPPPSAAYQREYRSKVPDGLPPRARVSAFVVDAFGHFWVALREPSGSALIRGTPTGKSSPVSGLRSMIGNDPIVSMGADDEGRVYIGTRSRGLFVWERGELRLHPATRLLPTVAVPLLAEADPDLPPPVLGSVQALSWSTDGALWICSHDHVIRWKE